MLRLAASVALTLAALTTVSAQPYPNRPITLIVPFPPGGSTDTTARIMAERMRPILGQPIIIENVGGAGGSIGVGRLARAPADGYTIDIGQWDTHVGSIIYKLNYDLEKDFEPVGLISNNPQLLVAKKNLAANTLPELVALMKKEPGKVTFVNQNAAANVSGILLQQQTQTEVTFIPYRGAGPAMTDLVSGPGRPAGRTRRGVATAGPRRHDQGDRQPLSHPLRIDPGHSDFGRRRRAGFPDVGLVRLLGAEGTPNEAIDKLNGAMRQVLADPAVKAKLSELGLDVASPAQQTPEGLAAFQKAEIEKWWPIIKAAGVKAE